MSKYRLPAPVLAPSDYVTRGRGESAEILGAQFHRNCVASSQRAGKTGVADPQKREKLATVLAHRALKTAAGVTLATKVVRGA